MADVRALLKAKRQEARITHHLASYSQNGQLSCVACGTLVKYTSAWEGHLGSKAHRTNVARLRDEEKAREERVLRERQEEMVLGKRKAEEQPSPAESDEDETKRRRVGDVQSEPQRFPTDFFSDPSRAPLPPPSDDSGDDEGNGPHPSPPPAAPPTAVDLEYERFQREMVNGPDHRETYERATVFAEPELAPELPQGFASMDLEATESEAPRKLSEATRRQKEEDERELIMDRLLDEEMAQEEADMKVSAMKAKVEALKKKREIMKGSKTK